MPDQSAHRVRFEWGATGAAAVGAAVTVVVDVLSFTTSVTIAAARGVTVLPFAWRDERAAAYAEERGATLAVGRSQTGVSLSPASLAAVQGVTRLVLPSPNGSSIATGLAARGTEVVAGCLRNRAAVGRHLAAYVERGVPVAVVAAGERWPDDTLRPCAEDLWGAGAVLAGIGSTATFSPEALLAVRSFEALGDTLGAQLRDCSSGRELVERGFAEDVALAAALDADDVVPVLHDGEFSA